MPQPDPANTDAQSLLIATRDPRGLLDDWPVLAARLATGDHRRHEFLAIEDWLLAMHDIPAEAEPALAAATLGLAGGGHGWLRVDALSLVIRRDRLVALPQAPEDATDAATLIDAVLSQAPAVGILHAAGPHRLLDLDAPADARFAPAWRTAGRPLDEHLPQGPRGADLRRWLTEAQMLLHEHPLNTERESRGLRPLNALWLAGGAAVAPSPRPRGIRVYGTHPLAAALPLASDTPSGNDQAAIRVWLHQPGQDPPEALVRALAAGRFQLRVLEPSGQQHYDRRPWHALRVWRKPLTSLSPAPA